MVDSRGKGARGELLVIRMIGPWWAAHEPGVEFARTPGSGGWQGRGSRGQKLRGEMRMGGDLMSTSSRFPFSVEVKNRKGWSLNRLMAGRPSPAWEWWIQCQTAAAESQLVPMLWLREAKAPKNVGGRFVAQPWYVMLPYSYAVGVPICPPLQAWTARNLHGVDYGAVLPILFTACTVLAVDPSKCSVRW